MNERIGAGKRNGLARRIWLLICSEGGKWAPEEIAEEFNVPRQVAALAMHNMTRRTGALNRTKAKGRAKFGVTRDCTIPHGITVEQIMEAGVAPSNRRGQPKETGHDSSHG